MALLAAMIWPLKGHPRGIPEGTEQLFGLYGDFTLSGNFEKGSPWRYESEVLMVAAQAEDLSHPQDSRSILQRLEATTPSATN